MSTPTYVLPSEGMLSVSAMNTRQINVMSNQIFEQNKRINLLHDQVVLMGSQLQSTQVHISKVDARVPSFMVITDVLKMLAAKINEVVHRVRANEEDERIMLADMQIINMELAMDSLMPGKGGKGCECSWNLLCNECFV